MTFHANDIVVDLYKSWKQICKFYKVMDTWGNCIFVVILTTLFKAFDANLLLYMYNIKVHIV